jgi:hypothetical protein
MVDVSPVCVNQLLQPKDKRGEFLITEITVKITFGLQNMAKERAGGLESKPIPPPPETPELQAMIPQAIPPVPGYVAGATIEGMDVQPPGFGETFAEVEIVPPPPEITNTEKMLTLPLPEEGEEVPRDIAPP